MTRSEVEQTKTSYLLANGWKPSPTTWVREGAFEHPKRARVPRAYANGETYDEHAIRLPKEMAVIVQAVHEQAVMDDFANRAHWSMRAMTHVAEMVVGLWDRDTWRHVP